jgi:hypothetical protein
VKGVPSSWFFGLLGERIFGLILHSKTADEFKCYRGFWDADITLRTQLDFESTSDVAHKSKKGQIFCRDLHEERRIEILGLLCLH